MVPRMVFRIIGGAGPAWRCHCNARSRGMLACRNRPGVQPGGRDRHNGRNSGARRVSLLCPALASAQPTCVDGCVFEAMDSCVPVKCREPFKHPPNGVLSGGSMAALDRLALNRNYLEYDEYVKITCNHGYMASDSAHSYWEPCKVSYIRECLADARLSNAEIRCEPLVCREITGSDHALQYNLSGTVSQVATYQPPGPRNYKTNVTLTCNAGYGLIGGAAERECSWTCQYTQAQAVCTASTCNTTLEGIHTSATMNRPCCSFPMPAWKLRLLPLAADSNTHWLANPTHKP